MFFLLFRGELYSRIKREKNLLNLPTSLINTKSILHNGFITYLYFLCCSIKLHTLYSPTQLCPESSVASPNSIQLKGDEVRNVIQLHKYKALIWCLFSRNNLHFQPTNISYSKTFHILNSWQAGKAGKVNVLIPKVRKLSLKKAL